MNELSLFTGAGGGLLGTKLLGWKAIGNGQVPAVVACAWRMLVEVEKKVDFVETANKIKA